MGNFIIFYKICKSMPIYENDEHEFLSARAKKIENNVYIDGNLFLTDKRIIFEKKGKRQFLRASPAVTDINLFLYNVENATFAIPKFSLFTKKILSIEYYNGDKNLVRVDFIIKDPKNWVNNITRLASISKKEYANNTARMQEDQKRYELEMAKARAPKANIGMAVFGGDKKNQGKINPGDYIDAESNENLPATNLKCPNCGADITDDMKYCPKCGYKLKKDDEKD
ncbi:hypothetical protein AOG54_00600 [Acidiplasma aeolicum]|jgi:ribosomal protein S27AE|nr:hypothetical protein AOG54_00600 [Acidiplasma aeolicum]